MKWLNFKLNDTKKLKILEETFKNNGIQVMNSGIWKLSENPEDDIWVLSYRPIGNAQKLLADELIEKFFQEHIW